MGLLDDGDKIASIVGAIAGLGSLAVAVISVRRSKECAFRIEGACPKNRFWSLPKKLHIRPLAVMAPLRAMVAILAWFFFLFLAVAPIICHLYGWL
jgi:hypothetical protein